ncbi:monocarboxylate transporter [Physcia stellaris]|nr:monocarboxylate transporter [Physcia stellaris]
MSRDSAAVAELIQEYERNIAVRARRVSKMELNSWTVEEVKGIMDRLVPRSGQLGSDEPCGPAFNRISKNLRSKLQSRLGIYAIIATTAGFLMPIQIWVTVSLLLRCKFSAIWRELPKPTVLLFDFFTGLDSFVKPPMSMVRESIEREEALCVNARGKFMLRKDGYAVLSHVWGETMGWMTKDAWGPVELDLRKKGIAYHHFQKFFHRCDAEWLWVDVLAMPEVYEDMSAAEKAKTQSLRIDIINCLQKIYTRADKVVCLDSLLLRLRSGSMIDVAVTLSLGRWINRLWPFTEAKLAKRVILKTEDASFDLDEIITFLYEIVNNENHRYFHLFARIVPLRPVPPGFRNWLGYLCRPGSYEPDIFREIFWGCENRQCDVEIDQARALFPVLGLKWVSGCGLQEGLNWIETSYPSEKAQLLRYCEYRGIKYEL